VNIHRASRRYARAILDLAMETGAAAAVEADLRALGRCIGASADLSAFFADVSLGRQRRAAVLEQLFRGRADPLVWRFVMFLESKRRLTLLPEICECFAKLCEEGRGEVRVTARTAVVADGALAAALAAGIDRASEAEYCCRCGRIRDYSEDLSARWGMSFTTTRLPAACGR
jgi:F-type H+-transporting ATPase subunit delta